MTDRRSVRNARRLAVGLGVALALLAGAGPFATAQVVKPADGSEAFPTPDLSPAVNVLLQQTYLTEDEKRAIRVRHGVWTEDDLGDPLLRARAALQRGAILDFPISNDALPAELRAEAALRRGEPAKSLELLAASNTMLATRLRAQALVDLGRPDDAVKLLTPVAVALQGNDLKDADEVAEGVRGMMILARLRGADAALGYQSLLGALGKARDELDRLSWRTYLAEAELLYEKDRYPDAGETLQAALSLNPRSSAAWYLLGRILVDGLEFPKAESVANKLDELAAPGISAEGAIVRAMIRLRQNEGEAAEQILAPALAKFPEHRMLLAVNAAAAAAKFDFKLADERLAAYDALAPGSPEAYMAAGRAVASARQYDEAAAYLREAAKRAPMWAEPVTELGLSELQAGHNDASEEALDKATALDHGNVRAANSLMLLKELRAYATVESEHFVIRAKPGQDEFVAREMLPTLERIYARVTGDGPGGIDHKPAGKTTVELYPDHRWFGVRITGLPQLHTIAAATGPVIAMEAPREGPNHMAGSYDWARVVQHEFTHTVTLSRTKNRLPHWFTEAGAVYLEDAPRDYSTVQLLTRAYENDELFNLDDINIAFARPKRPQDRPLAYAQGHWMYQYMIERFGPRTPLKLMDLYATGVREQSAFEQVMGIGREQFLTSFHEWAGKQLTQWGMLATDANPTVATLMERAKDRVVDKSHPDPLMIREWRQSMPDSPFVLEAAVRDAMEAGSGKITADDIPTVLAYAKARPVDPLPHKLLAAYYRAAAPSGAPSPESIPHLEYLDIREQHSPAYSQELARIYAASGDQTKALAKAERVTQISPYGASMREFAAGIAIRCKAYPVAQRQIEALIALEPDRPRHQERLDALRRLMSQDSPK